MNILDSDGTIVMGDVESRGSKLTILTCRVIGKPLLINPVDGDEIVTFVAKHQIQILNVAGNRESKLTIDEAMHINTVLQEGLAKLI
jgi:hypothetical protein